MYYSLTPHLKCLIVSQYFKYKVKIKIKDNSRFKCILKLKTTSWKNYFNLLCAHAFKAGTELSLAFKVNILDPIIIHHYHVSMNHDLADLKECCHCTSSITRQVKSLSSVSKHGKDERNYNEHKTMLIDPQISHCDCCYQECSTMRSSCSYIFTNIIIISKHRKISSDSSDSIQMHNLLHAWKLTLQSWTMLILCIRTFVFLLPGLYSLIR